MAEALTEREQKCLDHVKQAQELGVSFERAAHKAQRAAPTAAKSE